MKCIPLRKIRVLRNHIASFIAALVIGVIATSDALAAPDKKNPVSGQEVAQMYIGKTWTWSKGASYWGRNASFEAIWDGAVGIGKWYATTRGNLCYEATWKRDASGSGEVVKRCWLHVRDSQGRLWKQDSVTKDWHDAENEISERLKSGNSIRSEVRALRRKVGL